MIQFKEVGQDKRGVKYGTVSNGKDSWCFSVEVNGDIITENLRTFDDDDCPNAVINAIKNFPYATINAIKNLK